MTMQRVRDPSTFDYNQKCMCFSPNDDNDTEYEHEGCLYTFCRVCMAEKQEIVFPEDLSAEEPPILDSSSHIQTSSVRISDAHQAKTSLEVGDHIAWTRKKGIRWLPDVKFSHHAIVIEVGSMVIKIVHYAKEQEEDSKRKIHCKSLDLHCENDMEYRFLFRIKYPEELLKDNPPTMVKERALSRVGETSYDLLNNNCESFANYCKRGVARSLQVSRYISSSVRTIGGVLSGIAKSPSVRVWTAQFIFAEGTEAIVEGIKHVAKANVVGGVLYLAAEGFVCCVDIYKMFEGRNDKRITKEQLQAAVVKRIVLAVCRGAIGAASSFALGSLGFAVGFVIGNMVLPVAGGVPGGAIGSIIGSVLGGVGGVATFEGSRTIGWSFINSETISSIEELHPGDHIVLPGESLFHPRCHAIVTELMFGGLDDFLKVIRNDYKRGVVEEWIHFVEMKRMKYNIGECYTPDIVIHRARERLYEKKYNIATNNCKTFAKKQKMKDELNF